MQNIPLRILRKEFESTFGFVNDEQFVIALKSSKRPISIGFIDWYGSSNDLASILVQRAVMGVESYTIAAVWHSLIKLGKLTPELNKKVRNPFKIRRGLGTAEAYYDALPAIASESLSFKYLNEESWPELKEFYKNIRNPLFHGEQFSNGYAESIKYSFDVIQILYKWLDEWYVCP